MSGELSKGYIQRIFDGETNLTPALLQIVNVRQNENKRSVVEITDTMKTMKGLMPSSWDQRILSGEVVDGTIVQVNKYIVNKIQGMSMMIILDFEVLQKDCCALWDPENTGKPNPPMCQPKPSAGGFGGQRSGGFGGNSGGFGAQKSGFGGGQAQKNNPFGGSAGGTDGDDQYQPVTALSPYQKDFKIKVRCTRKGPIRTWSNSRGDGKLFSVDLLDSSGGEIQATCFNDAAEKFFPMLEEGKVYIISKGRVKVSNKRYTHITNDYCIDLTPDSEVVYVGEDTAIQSMTYNFQPINALAGMADKTFVDICGICDHVSEVQEFESKRTGKALRKRGFRLVDQSGAAVECVLWGDEADKFSMDNKDKAVCLKAGRVSEFNGKSVSCNQYEVDPPGIHEVAALLEWYKTGGSTMSFTSMTQSRGGGGRNEPAISLREAEQKGLGNNDTADYFNVKVMVTSIPANFEEKQPWYKAVPTDDGPSYKVVQSEDGVGWFCEKTNTTHPNYKCKYILRMKASDHTGEQWFNAYDDVSKVILGKPAGEVEEFVKNDDKDSFMNVFNNASFSLWNFRVRAKQDVYQDEARRRMDVVGAEKIDYVKDGQFMMQNISAMLATAA